MQPKSQNIELGENAYPEYTSGSSIIPHAHARFITSTHVCLHLSATLLYSEIDDGRTQVSR